MSLLITLLFTGLNGYFAVQSFRQKRWGWFALSAVLTLFCASPLLRFIP